jgi:hypothetical protein
MRSVTAGAEQPGGDTMPKIIDVTLQQIACTANGFGGAVQLSGDLFGITFNNELDNPNDVDQRHDIFPFPNGPISISQGQVVPITMRAVTFSMAAPSAGPSTTPKFLKIGGELNDGLGSQFFVIGFQDPLPFITQTGFDPPPPPRKFNLDYRNANLAITLTFGAGVTGAF